MAFKNLLTGATLAAVLTSRAAAVNNGLAITPQMGWDNWNSLGCDVSETLLLQTGQLIVDYGLRDLGYHYVILDDCWSAGRNASNNNSLIPDPKKFPNGMASVADKLHNLGLGYGMYSDAGTHTCGGYAGSLGHETVDANTFASWGVDYLKYDNCYNNGEFGNETISSARYTVMARALNATGRPILYSLCSWGQDFPWDWGGKIANSWRISGDVWDSYNQPTKQCPCDGANAFNCTVDGYECSIINIANKDSFIVSKAGPGGWNDLDMLEVGNGGMTDPEYITHFSLWAAAKSPLIMGNDIRNIPAKDLSILSNPAVIAVNQDPAGVAAARRWIYGITPGNIYGGAPTIQLWSGKLQSTTGGRYNDMVVLLVNGANKTMVLNATLADIFVNNGTLGTTPEMRIPWEVRDLWANRMSVSEAQAIISSSSATGRGSYNATETSYARGLASQNPLLLGNVTTTVAPSGTITASIESHGAAMFRLRALPPR